MHSGGGGGGSRPAPLGQAHQYNPHHLVADSGGAHGSTSSSSSRGDGDGRSSGSSTITSTSTSTSTSSCGTKVEVVGGGMGERAMVCKAGWEVQGIPSIHKRTNE